MALSIEHAIHERLKICENRCENTHSQGFKEEPIRCPNEHNKHGATYKGRVFLMPFYMGKESANIEHIRMWCYKCHKEHAISKHSRKLKPRKKVVDEDQTDLFN